MAYTWRGGTSGGDYCCGDWSGSGNKKLGAGVWVCSSDNDNCCFNTSLHGQHCCVILYLERDCRGTRVYYQDNKNELIEAATEDNKTGTNTNLGDVS